MGMLTASCTFDGFALAYLPVINSGRWFGKTWLVELLGVAPVWVVVEAGSIRDALVVLSTAPDFGRDILVAHVQGDDDPEGDGGLVLNTENVRVHGREHCDFPYPVRYHDEGYPTQGIDPRHYAVAPFN